jgi:hypothetical protein
MSEVEVGVVAMKTSVPANPGEITLNHKKEEIDLVGYMPEGELLLAEPGTRS